MNTEWELTYERIAKLADDLAADLDETVRVLDLLLPGHHPGNYIDLTKPKQTLARYREARQR